MADPTPEELAELRKLAEAATPGPWCQHPNGTSVWRGPDWETINESFAHGPYSHVCNAASVTPRGIDDMGFIAAANPATVLRLLDALDSRDRELVEIRATLARLKFCAACLLGDEPPHAGVMRDGTGEPGAYMCDECFREWQRGQVEPVQW